ncbi:hypothetical protein EIP86_000878 [Pleurotus ostreatoroseus]|nr:hypothetical protein EIP86_000878 [Pleurotus ostreatoroseus]
MTTPRRKLNILDLNADVFAIIFDLVSVQDACSFRLCSRAAAQVAARHAMTAKTVRLPEDSWFKFMATRRETLVFLRTLTLHLSRNYEHVVPSLPNVLADFLQASSELKALSSNTPEEAFENIARFHDAVGKLSRLQSLKLSKSGLETSYWLLDELHGGLPNLTSLHLGQLSFSSRPVPSLLTLRELSVGSLSGKLESLVQLAPNLERLVLVTVENKHGPGYIPCIVHPCVVSVVPSRIWRSLHLVSGQLNDVHFILPLFQRVHRLVFTHHKIRTANQDFMGEVLAKQPRCLEFDDGHKDEAPFLYYRQLHHVAQHLFYLRRVAECGEGTKISSMSRPRSATSSQYGRGPSGA